MRFQAPMTHICFREQRLRVSRVNSSCSHHTMEKQRHAGLQTLKPLTHSGTMHIGCRSMQSYSFCQHSYKLSARLSQMDPRFLLSKCLDISSPSPARPLHPYCSCSSKRHVRARGTRAVMSPSSKKQEWIRMSVKPVTVPLIPSLCCTL